MIFKFFKGLVDSRVESAKAVARGKGMGAVAKVKGKTANTFNAAVAKGVKGAKNKAVGAAKGAKGVKGPKLGKKKDKGQKKDKKQGSAMNVFGKKKGGQAPPPEMEESAELQPDMKTVALDISQFSETERKECVGWVVPLSGSQKGEDFRLVPGKNLIGTAADCDIVISDTYISAKHATIHYEDGNFSIVDLDSTNGSFLNDHKLTGRDRLVDNDKLRLGRVELKFKSL